MNCDDVCRLMSAGESLPESALEHVRRCSVCSSLFAIGATPEGYAIRAETEERVIAAITRDLRPVRPLWPSWFYAAAIVAAGVAVAAAGITFFGTAGWRRDSSLQRGYFMACIAIGVALAAAVAARLMAPGTLLPVTPVKLTALLSATLGAGVLLYPAVFYDHFAKAVAACLAIGFAHATIVSALVIGIVRRGDLSHGPTMYAAIVLPGSVAGFAVLFAFCPHRDVGHIGLAHATVPLLAMALALWLARRKPA